MISTATSSMVMKMTLIVLESMESVTTRTWPMSISNRATRFKWSITRPTLKIWMPFKIGKSWVCSTIATFKCKIHLQTGQTRGRCPLRSLTSAMRRKSMTLSSKRSWSSSRRSWRPGKTALTGPSSTPRGEMVQLVDKPADWSQTCRLPGLTNWGSS